MTENELNHDRRTLVMSELMTPDMVNFRGTIHGGHILSFLDRVAYVCASRYSGKNVVTLSVDEVLFKEPIYVGELVIFYACVNYVGTTSMEVGVRVMAENLFSHESRHAVTCYFTMVGVDENGKPIKISPLTIGTPTQKRRFEEAQGRKQMRLQFKMGKKK